MFPKGIIQNRRMCLRPSAGQTRGGRPRPPPKTPHLKVKTLLQGNGPQDFGGDGAGQHVGVLEGTGVLVLFSPTSKEPPAQKGPQLIAGKHSPLTTERENNRALLREVSRDTGSHCHRTRKLNKVQGRFWKTPCYCCLNNWPETWLPLPKHVSVYRVSASVPRQTPNLWRACKSKSVMTHTIPIFLVFCRGCFSTQQKYADKIPQL